MSARARAADAEAVGGPILCATSDEVEKAGRLRRGRQRQARQAEAEARASDAANVVRMALLLFQPATLAPAQAQDGTHRSHTRAAVDLRVGHAPQVARLVSLSLTSSAAYASARRSAGGIWLYGGTAVIRCARSRA